MFFPFLLNTASALDTNDIYRYAFTAESDDQSIAGRPLDFFSILKEQTNTVDTILTLGDVNYGLPKFIYNQTADDFTLPYLDNKQVLTVGTDDNNQLDAQVDPTKLANHKGEYLSYGNSIEDFVACMRTTFPEVYELYYAPGGRDGCTKVKLRSGNKGPVFANVSDAGRNSGIYNLTLSIDSDNSELSGNVIGTTSSASDGDLIGLRGFDQDTIPRFQTQFVYDESTQEVRSILSDGSSFPLVLGEQNNTFGLSYCPEHALQFKDGYLSYNGSEYFTIYNISSADGTSGYAISPYDPNAGSDAAGIRIKGDIGQGVAPSDTSIESQKLPYSLDSVPNNCKDNSTLSDSMSGASSDASNASTATDSDLSGNSNGSNSATATGTATGTDGAAGAAATNSKSGSDNDNANGSNSSSNSDDNGDGNGVVTRTEGVETVTNTVSGTTKATNTAETKSENLAASNKAGISALVAIAIYNLI